MEEATQLGLFPETKRAFPERATPKQELESVLSELLEGDLDFRGARTGSVVSDTNSQDIRAVVSYDKTNELIESKIQAIRFSFSIPFEGFAKINTFFATAKSREQTFQRASALSIAFPAKRSIECHGRRAEVEGHQRPAVRPGDMKTEI